MNIMAMIIYGDIKSKDPRMFDFAAYMFEAVNYRLE